MISDHESHEYNRGWRDYTMGISINDCPYRGKLARTQWMVGWIEALGTEELCNPLANGTFRVIK